MNASGFVNYWSARIDTIGLIKPTVGIAISWSRIKKDAKVRQFTGQDGWKYMGCLWTPIWGNFKRTKLSDWLDTKRKDYQLFIDEEKIKIGFYRNHGLPTAEYREFCGFMDIKGNTGILGDGNHRFIDCNYLTLVEKKDLSQHINNIRLDIIYLDNLQEVLSDQDLPPDYIFN